VVVYLAMFGLAWLGSALVDRVTYATQLFEAAPPASRSAIA
jgi:hypothetical protein